MNPTTEHTEHTDPATNERKKGRLPTTIVRYVAVWFGLVILAVSWKLAFPDEGVLGAIGLGLGIVALAMTGGAFLWYLVGEVRSQSWLFRVDRRAFWSGVLWTVLVGFVVIAFSQWRENRQNGARREIAMSLPHRGPAPFAHRIPALAGVTNAVWRAEPRGKTQGRSLVPGPTDWHFECWIPEASRAIPGIAEAVEHGRESGSGGIGVGQDRLKADRLLASPELDAIFFPSGSASTVGHAFYDPEADILVLEADIN